jgi:cellulose biosynthesis protein BcsQ
MESNRGKIITFYSYKGGTGRSMALANIACLLSRRADVRRGVLAIDWDLEAPGLHWFFRRPAAPQEEPDLSSLIQNGVIDLFEQLSSRAGTGDGPLSEEAVDEIVSRFPLKEFVVRTELPRVNLMRAGRFDDGYPERVTTFDWRRLFGRAPSLIRSIAERLASMYDFVLVDSRTGLNDTSGICTALLPDQLVLVFTPNRQSLLGGIDAVAKATRYRIESEDLRPLAVIPLPSRVDVSEPKLLEKWRFGDSSGEEDEKGYQLRLEGLFAEVYGLPSCSLKNYFDEIQIQYVPRYAYGEEIAALHERGTRLSLSRSYAAVADLLAKNEAPWAVPPATQGGAELLSGVAPAVAKAQAAKEYLSEDRFKLKLHDLTLREVRDVLEQMPHFSAQAIPSPLNFAERLHAYEAATNDLLRIQALLGYWGEASHRSLLGLAPKRISDQISFQGGITVWVASNWYPVQLLLYAGGIASVADQRYQNLHNLMVTPIKYTFDGVGVEPTLIRAVAESMLALDRAKAFKMLPGFERGRTPRSNYLYALLQPILEEVLFLGSEYESAFDRFELLYALEYCHRYDRGIDDPFRFWGPVGRFAAKEQSPASPLSRLLAEASAEGSFWAPVQAGFFGGSIDRFNEVAGAYLAMISGIPWWLDE